MRRKVRMSFMLHDSKRLQYHACCFALGQRLISGRVGPLMDKLFQENSLQRWKFFSKKIHTLLKLSEVTVSSSLASRAWGKSIKR